jgi:hypothetical protein
MLVTRNGFTYRQADHRSWLRDAGFPSVEIVPIARVPGTSFTGARFLATLRIYDRTTGLNSMSVKAQKALEPRTFAARPPNGAAIHAGSMKA